MTGGFPTVERSSPRDIWKHEAHEFTPWLATNIERLGEVLGRELVVEDTERDTPTGFSVDLFVTDAESGDPGVIEAQFGSSDHKHLGQLLTYLTAFEAEFAIWIVHEARYEHRRVVEWINESSDKTTYLVSVEALTLREEATAADGSGKVGPAPLFTVLSEPSPESRGVGERKREFDKRGQLQLEFHQGLKDSLPASFDLFDNIRAKDRQYISASEGPVSYAFHVTDTGAYAQMYIDTGDGDENLRLFEQLESQRAEIESEVGSELVWNRMDGSRACRIHTPPTASGLRDKDQWPEVQADLVGYMPKLYEALSSRLAEM